MLTELFQALPCCDPELPLYSSLCSLGAPFDYLGALSRRLNAPFKATSLYFCSVKGVKLL